MGSGTVGVAAPCEASRRGGGGGGRTPGGSAAQRHRDAQFGFRSLPPGVFGLSSISLYYIYMYIYFLGTAGDTND
jgi:hypothetical protein